LKPTGEHRVDDHAIAVELEQQEFAASADRINALADKGAELTRSASDRERARSLGGPDLPPSEGRVERLGDDRQIR
jgi:hypothetical protein